MSNYSPLGQLRPLGDFEAKAPINVTVTTANTQILPANESRKAVFFSNVGNQDIFLSEGVAAVVNSGGFIPKSEGLSIGIAGPSPLGVINGICSAGSSIVSIWEFE